MRPIDADALIELLEPHGLGKGSACGWHSGIIDIVIDEISKMPTIGGWITTWDNKRKKYVTHCLPLPEPPKEEADEHND